MGTKTIKRLYVGTIATTVTLLGSFGFGSASAATTAQLYLTPATQTVAVGQNFTVSVRLNPGTDVDTVDAHVSYNPSILRYVSSNSSASPFSTQIVASGSNGNVSLTRTVLSPGIVNSDALVATITFTALAAANDSPLTLTGNVAYAGNDVAKTTTSGTVITVSDTIAPVVNIKKPLDKSESKTMFAVKVGATDNVKVTKMEIYADGTKLYSAATNSINPYNWDVSSSSVADGTHTITVKAYDAAGNVGSSSVTVTK